MFILVVHVFCFLSEAGVDLLVMVGVCVMFGEIIIVDVFAVLWAFCSVCGGGIIGC